VRREYPACSRLFMNEEVDRFLFRSRTRVGQKVLLTISGLLVILAQSAKCGVRSNFQAMEHQSHSHGRRASLSAVAGPATSRIVPWSINKHLFVWVDWDQASIDLRDQAPTIGTKLTIVFDAAISAWILSGSVSKSPSTSRETLCCWASGRTLPRRP